MAAKNRFIPVLFIFLALVLGCSVVGGGGIVTPQSAGLALVSTQTMVPSATAADPAAVGLPATNYPTLAQPSKTSTQTASPAGTITPAPVETELVYQVGRDITIKYLR
ncbi:MAG: hypothetical protein P8Y14_27025, partial [Anaerolineales bacterium]